MSLNLSRKFQMLMLMFSFLSSAVLADPAEELARAEAAYNSENLSLTIELLMSAAKQGYAPAQARLGEILYLSQYEKDAVEWYRKAAEQGNLAGEYGLGRMYASGEGIEKDNEKALYWLKFAADSNYLPALRFLANAYQTGDLGLAIDLNQAKLWGDKANALEAKAKKAAARKAAKKTTTIEGK